MTDNEIIKALECCVNVKDVKCNECPLIHSEKFCFKVLHETTLDLIDRQKAEIERLEKEIESLNKQYPCVVKMSDYCLVYTRSLDDYDKLIDEIKSEAIKEFAERLKPTGKQKYISYARVERLVKEMTEGKDNEI